MLLPRFDDFVVVATLDPARNAHGNDVKYHYTLADADVCAAKYTADWYKSVVIKQRASAGAGYAVIKVVRDRYGEYAVS